MPDPTPPSSTLVAFPLARDVVVAEGPDAATYLQGQLSQDVAGMPVDSSRWTFVLAPQGKVEVWARVTREADDRFLLDVDAGAGEGARARLARFLLRTRAELVLLPATGSSGWALRGASAAELDRWDPPHGVYLDAPVGLAGADGRDLVATHPFDPPPGAREGAAPELERWRIAHGIPAAGAEIGPDVIPAELGRRIIDASVSFTKGCYTGQELVARVDSRGGNVPRHLRVVEAPAGTAMAVGAVLVDPEHGEVGTITSVAAGSPVDPVLALGFVRRVASGATVLRLGAPDGPEVRVAEPGD